jgi:hypothetical protein
VAGRELGYLLTVAALRSLKTDRAGDLPFRRRTSTPTLVAVLAGEFLGFALLAYLIARVL